MRMLHTEAPRYSTGCSEPYSTPMYYNRHSSSRAPPPLSLQAAVTSGGTPHRGLGGDGLPLQSHSPAEQPRHAPPRAVTPIRPAAACRSARRSIDTASAAAETPHLPAQNRPPCPTGEEGDRRRDAGPPKLQTPPCAPPTVLDNGQRLGSSAMAETDPPPPLPSPPSNPPSHFRPPPSFFHL